MAAPRRFLFPVGLFVLASWTAGRGFVAGPPALARRAAAPRHLAARRAGSAFDTLVRLPELITEAVEDAQDMLGLGDGGKIAPMEMSTVGMAQDGVSSSAIMQTMTLRAEAGSEGRLARQINRFVAASRTDGLVMTASATQNQEDPCDFMVLLRYESMHTMRDHQTQASFKEMLDKMEPHLEKPIGLYLMDEQFGQAGMARYPFGPGGEGGRDDAIYSSRRKGR